MDVEPLVTSPTVNATSGKVFLSTGTPQAAPDAAMQTLTNVGQHLQKRSKQPGIRRFSCQMDIRILISNMWIWWSTCEVTWQMQGSPTHRIANYAVQKSHIKLFLYIKALVLK